MFFKVLVFDGCHRVVENFGALLVRHQDAPLQRKASYKLAVIGIDLGDNRWAIRFERVNLRQVARINKQQPASCSERNRTKQKKRERDAVNQFPTSQSQRDRWQA